MTSKLDTILDDCLAELRAGAMAEDCLARYPEHGAALQPLLALAVQVQTLPVHAPDRAAMNAGRQRMIEAVRARAIRREQGGPLGLAWLRRSLPFRGSAFGRPVMRTAVSVALMFLVIALSTGGLLVAAQESLPGDLLYPLKRTGENVRMSVTFDSAAQQELQSQLDRERQEEVRSILAEGRPTSLEFRGVLEHVDVDYWIVAGLKLHLDDQSIIEGQRVLGAIVAVHADSLSDGTLMARRLQIESSHLMPSPTPTRTASPTPLPPTASTTPTQTESQEPTASPMPTPTRQATSTPSLTLTVAPQPQPTDPPIPTETGVPESTGQPEPGETEEPESNNQPEPGETEEPESTNQPEPGETEEPESTDQPEPSETEEPESTDQPEPGETEEPESTNQPEPTATEDDENAEHQQPLQTGTPEPAASTTSTPTGEPDSSGR